MEGIADREFRYRAPRHMVGLHAVLVASAAVGAGMWLMEYLGPQVPGADGGPWRIPLWGSAFLAFVAVRGACAMAQEALLARRGGVNVTAAGIAARDWRGREQALLWHDVRKMQAYRYDAWFPPSRAILVLHGEASRLSVGGTLRSLGELRDIIIKRAGLTEEHGKWWGTLYTRSGG